MSKSISTLRNPAQLHQLSHVRVILANESDHLSPAPLGGDIEIFDHVGCGAVLDPYDRDLVRLPVRLDHFPILRSTGRPVRADS